MAALKRIKAVRQVLFLHSIPLSVCLSVCPSVRLSRTLCADHVSDGRSAVRLLFPVSGPEVAGKYDVILMAMSRRCACICCVHSTAY